MGTKNKNEDYIKIRGARVHNLKSINLDIPKNKLVVITGVSGSGKSSLAFDLLYAEGQRRYVESLSAYARQFLGVMDKPEVEKIEGISPAISIDQRKAMRNPRSTVGTITEIYDYLRLLYARIGKPHCPKCGKFISRQTIDQIVEQVFKLKDSNQQRNKQIFILGPVIRGKKGEHKAILREIQGAGFVRVRIDGKILTIEEALEEILDRNKKHSIEAVVDRLILDETLERARLVDSLGTALKLGKGVVIISLGDHKKDLIFSEHFGCEECGVFLPELEPRLFSFNSPYGACPECMGLGEKLEVHPDLVIPNKRLAIAEGAIFPWSRASHRVGRQSYYYSKLWELAQRHNFSLDEPVGNLPQSIIDIILYGEPGFEGVIPNLERRYHETDSEWTKQEIEQYMVTKICPSCRGKRLKPEVLAVTIEDYSIDKICALPIEKAKVFFENLSSKLKGNELKISQAVIKEIINRLTFLEQVGLSYLSLDRKADTLSGGEEQRIRLATQLGSKLSGVLYILDEPSIGLHPRDQNRLINTLKELKKLGNSVIVVEHDPQTIKSADWVIDIGPGAGKHGGRVVFEGTPSQLLKANTLTGKYLSGRLKVVVPSGIQGVSSGPQRFLVIKGARHNNLKSIDVKIPLERLVCITGVSGSGKSSLINDILARALLKKFYRAKEEPGEHQEILGVEHLNKVVIVDQSPIGRTPRSNPATYTGVFSYIREIFSRTKEARIRGYSPSSFSFNLKGGRCEACEGQGQKRVEMYFLPDIYVECQECHGKRYNKDILEITYRNKNIVEVLEMTVEEALDFFKNIPGLYEKLKTLQEVGLSYLQLGQPTTALSGGEAQRIKLATELGRRETGKTLYILDEPTTGLHFDDIKKLLAVLKRLVFRGNSVIVVEHNLDFIFSADYIIDLGPEGGEKGGKIVAEGSPIEIMKTPRSYTGQYLKKYINAC